jgi:hypothetical protein
VITILSTLRPVLMGPEYISNKYAHIQWGDLWILSTPFHCICAYLFEIHSGPVRICLIKGVDQW